MQSELAASKDSIEALEQRQRRSEEDDTQLGLKDSPVKEALALQDIRRIEFG